jgi:MT0933-like antitoxin protein
VQEGINVKFGDKLKDLRKQAQDVVAENREKIHDAVEVVGTTVDQKTGGKHSAKIAKFGEQAGAAVDRFSESDAADGGEADETDETGEPRAADGSSPRTPAPESPPPPSAGTAPPAEGERFGGPPPAFDE